MSYTQFSTDSADYYLVYGHHREEEGINEDIFQKSKIESLDAVVLESGRVGYTNKILHHHLYTGIVKNIKIKNTEEPKNTNIYLVDVDVPSPGLLNLNYSLKKGVHLLVGGGLALSAASDFKERASRRQFLKGGLKALASSAIFGSFMGVFINYNIGGKAIPVVAKIESMLGYMPPLPGVELRNSIAARKIEEYIVPELWGGLGRKPLVAIVYGGAHVGIETDLKFKGMRDSVIRTYETLGYPGIKTDDLDYIYEIDFKKNKGRRIKVNLF